MQRVFIQILILLVTVFYAGCYSTFAPPARMTHYGAPGKTKARQMEVAAAVSDQYEIGGELDVGISLGDNTTLEFGTFFVPGYLNMGFAGFRFSPLRAEDTTWFVRPTLDMEYGLGMGRGGMRCYAEQGVCDDIDWKKRVATGAFVGVGVGINIRWFDAFLRGRYQITLADNSPLTHWMSSVVGVQFTFLKYGKIYFAGGAARYDNPADAAWSLLGEAGFSVVFNFGDKRSVRN